MSLILELPEKLEQQLRAGAEKMQTSPETFAVSMLEKALAPEANGELSDAEFEVLARGVIDDNRELLERLA